MRLYDSYAVARKKRATRVANEVMQISSSRSHGRTLSDVSAWRARRLVRAGFAAQLAELIVADPCADIHALLELVDRGCPPELAARILAPLEEEPGGRT
jgi:acetylornithine/succinyldiaminopimelate/putrescine aminotransferase